MTPLIPSIVTNASQILSPMVSKEVAATSASPFENLLSSAMKSNSNTPAPEAQNEVKSLKQLSTKDLSNQNIQSKELITKEPLNKDFRIEGQVEIKAEKDLQTTDQSNFLNEQMMLASLLQQPIAQTPNNSAQQATTEENVLKSQPLNSVLNDRLSDQMSSFNNEDLNLDPAQMQMRLSEGKNLDLTKQLSQLHSKLDLGDQESSRDAARPLSPPITPNTVNQATGMSSSEKSFSFLDQSLTALGELNDSSSANNTASGLQFAEHLSQKNHEISRNQASTDSAQQIKTPFQSPDWGPALHQRVTWMIKDQMQNATITINPPHLGQIEVKLQTNQAQQTSVLFMSNNHEVRQAITDHLGTLREMMAQSGLQLGQADVGARDQSGSAQYGSSANKKSNNPNFFTPEITSTESSQGIGLINTYA